MSIGRKISRNAAVAVFALVTLSQCALFDTKDPNATCKNRPGGSCSYQADQCLAPNKRSRYEKCVWDESTALCQPTSGYQVAMDKCELLDDCHEENYVYGDKGVEAGCYLWYKTDASKVKRAIVSAVEDAMLAPASAQLKSVSLLEYEDVVEPITQEQRRYYYGYVVMEAHNMYGTMTRQKYCAIIYEKKEGFYWPRGKVKECAESPTPAERLPHKIAVGWTH